MCPPPLLWLLLAAAAAPAAAPAPAPAAAPPGRPRARRGLTYPGTLWCGAGSNADSYEQLGEHRDTDRCCRDHDHCAHVIHPFTTRYGYRNLRWHTLSHCDCDRRLRTCLRRVNDTASRVVGQAFFNVLRVPCFEFAYREECVEPYLYVWCRAYDTVAVAVLREPALYDFGGELIDGAAGSPRGGAGAAAPAEHRAPALGQRPLPTPPAAPAEKRKKKKGKGLRKKGPWDKGRLSPPAAEPPERRGSAELASLDVGGKEEAPNAALSNVPDGDGLGKELALVLPSTAPAAGRKKRRKERNRKKRLKPPGELEPV